MVHSVHTYVDTYIHTCMHSAHMHTYIYMYKVGGQIKQGQLSFLLVTTEYIYKFNDFGTYKLHQAASGKMPILS